MAVDDVAVVETGRSLPGGAVGVIIRAPADAAHAYRVRFVDGAESTLQRDEFRILHAVRESGVGEAEEVDWTRFVVFRCVVGSRAYGLEHEESDVDRRGIYLPPADLQWALYGVPEQLENDATQEVYWELEKFLKLDICRRHDIEPSFYYPSTTFDFPAASWWRRSCVTRTAAGIRRIWRCRIGCTSGWGRGFGWIREGSGVSTRCRLPLKLLQLCYFS